MSNLKLPTRAEDFSEWYNLLVLRAELADYAPVRGCTWNGVEIWYPENWLICSGRFVDGVASGQLNRRGASSRFVSFRCRTGSWNGQGFLKRRHPGRKDWIPPYQVPRVKHGAG